MPINFAAIQARQPWRKHRVHQSFEAAIDGKDGAKNLLLRVGRVREMWTKYGDVLGVFVWEDGVPSGSAFRLSPHTSNGIESVLVPMPLILNFDEKKGCSSVEFARLFDPGKLLENKPIGSPGTLLGMPSLLSTPFLGVDERTLQAILTRRGQADYRARLLKQYDNKCAITGCRTIEVLEAAHIIPFAVDQTYDLAGGLLLRADVHTLFDLFLISIEPSNFAVRIAPQLAAPYQELDGVSLAMPTSRQAWPSADRVERHYEEWVRRCEP